MYLYNQIKVYGNVICMLLNLKIFIFVMIIESYAVRIYQSSDKLIQYCPL